MLSEAGFVFYDFVGYNTTYLELRIQFMDKSKLKGAFGVALGLNGEEHRPNNNNLSFGFPLYFSYRISKRMIFYLNPRYIELFNDPKDYRYEELYGRHLGANFGFRLGSKFGFIMEGTYMYVLIK